LLPQSRGMVERRQLTGRRPLLCFVALLFVVGCGSSLPGTGGTGGDGSSACPQNTRPTTTVCCAGFSAQGGVSVQAYVCDDSTLSWMCPPGDFQDSATNRCMPGGTGSGGSSAGSGGVSGEGGSNGSGGSTGSGGSNGSGGSTGSGGRGGNGGGAGSGAAGAGGRGGAAGAAGSGEARRRREWHLRACQQWSGRLRVRQGGDHLLHQRGLRSGVALHHGRRLRARVLGRRRRRLVSVG
jgi:hypothetical protein